MRMLPVFAGSPLLIDDANLMDAEYDGIPLPEATIEAIDRCRFTTWLIPRGGEPFTLRNFLDGHPLFDGRFRAAFARRYRKVAETPYIDVWRCSSAR
jgi:hypothetical protein